MSLLICMEQENTYEKRLEQLEASVQAILARNQRVEVEKAWEQSTARVLGILIITYALMCLIFYLIGAQNFMINAVIPTLGYYLSTQSLSILKRRWVKKQTRDY